jgi:hypothetical protein
MTESFKHLLSSTAKLVGTADRAASDAVIIKSGNASVGDSGAIVLRPGTAVGVRGSIILDGTTVIGTTTISTATISTATIGGTAFPTSSGTNGQWMVANGSGAAAWTSPEESGAVPAGTIMPFAGINCPTGWFFCDGAEKSKTTYARLWNALKNAGGTAGVWDNCKKNEASWGTWANPATGNFRLPDLRTLFIRGAGANQAGVTTTLAISQDDSTARNGLAGASTSVSVSGSSTTENDSPDHTHSYTRADGGGANGTGTGAKLRESAQQTGGASARHKHAFSLTSTGTITPNLSIGDSETRPDCVGLNYIIKY